MAKKYKLTQDGPEVQALLNKIDGLKANQTPGQGVEPVQMENLSLGGVLYAFLTSAVSNLLYYYTKSETYSKSEVDALVAAIKQFTIQSVDALPQPPSADTMNILYLVPAEEPKVANEKDEFITVIKDGSYAWEQVGSTAVDLSGYVTTEALNAALADYVTSDALATALAGLHDVRYTEQSLTAEQKAQARTNIGATAPEVFWAVYGTTTVAEIEAALNAGKIVAMLYSNKVYFVTANNATNYLVFTSPSDDTIFNIRVNRSDSSYGNPFNLTYEQAGRKKSTITGNESSDTYYPTTKAVADAIEAGKQIFWAEYGVNTLSEITTAYNSGKAVLCLRLGALHVISKLETTYCYFTCVNRTVSQFLLLNGQTSWSAGTVSLQSTGNLSQSIETDQASTTKYPSTKAVADALATKYTKPASGIPASDLASGVVPDVSGKADKVQGATAGHLAGLNAAGNPTDTGLVPLDIPLFPNMDGLTPMRTIEYDVSRNGWCSLFKRGNPSGTLGSNVSEVIACRITVTGEDMLEPQVVDIFAFMVARVNTYFPAFVCGKTPDVSSASKYGINNVRELTPKVIGSGYPWEIEFHTSTATTRHLKIDIFSGGESVVFAEQQEDSTFASSGQNAGPTTAAERLRALYTAQLNIDGSANSAAYINSYLPAFCASAIFFAGEQLSNGNLAFMSTDGKAYKVGTTNKPISPEAGLFVVGTDINIGTSIGYAYSRRITSGIGISNLSATVDTIVARDELFLRCNLVNGEIFSDGHLAKTMSPGYTWVSVGIAAGTATIAFSTIGKEFFTLDANGKLTHVNGREIAVPASGVQDVTLGGTSVVSAGVAVLPAYPEDQLHIAYYQSTTWAQINEWIEDDNKPIILFAPGAYRNVTAIYCGTDDYGNHLFFSFDDYDNISKFVLGEQGWSTDVIEIQHLIDSQHKLDYSLLSNTPTIPTVESMTAQEVATAVTTAWNNVIGG